MDNFLTEFSKKLNTGIRELWKNNKVFVIVFGIIILIIKFRDVIIDVLLNSSKRVLKEAESKDQDLKKQQDSANSQADRLVDEAKNMDSKADAEEDWHKNKK